jgi:hypothetical protein
MLTFSDVSIFKSVDVFEMGFFATCAILYCHKYVSKLLSAQLCLYYGILTTYFNYYTGKSKVLTNDLLPSQKNAWSGSTQHKTQFNKCLCSLLKQYILDYSLLCTQLLQGFLMMICGNPHIRF